MTKVRSVHFDRTFVTMMTPGSSSGKSPLSEPHIIPWRREHRGLSPKQTTAVAHFTKLANALNHRKVNKKRS